MQDVEDGHGLFLGLLSCGFIAPVNTISLEVHFNGLFDHAGYAVKLFISQLLQGGLHSRVNFDA